MAIPLNAKDFRENARQFIDGDVLNISKLTKAVATDALRNLIQYTPFATGRARANWRVSYGTPATEFDWNRKDWSGMETYAEGEAKINSALSVTESIYIANNTPYIGDLEDGHPSHGEFQEHNANLGFMGARTHTYLQTKYRGAAGLG